MPAMQGSAAPIRESIDLRLSEVFNNESAVIMEVQDGAKEPIGPVHRPRKESSPIMPHHEDEEESQTKSQQPAVF